MKLSAVWSHPLMKIKYIFTHSSFKDNVKIDFVDENKKVHLDSGELEGAMKYYSKEEKATAKNVFDEVNGALISGLKIYPAKMLSQPLLIPNDVSIIKLDLGN